VSSIITDGATVTQPLTVDGYQSARQSRHVFNTVIGRAYPDVTLAPATQRRGTLRLVYTTEAAAAACERIHAGTAILTFTDSDLPTAGMTYVVDGSITRQLDPESRFLWTVTIDYQEVTL
jgi:hypothetical protein